jgi:hypothetical protein
MHRAPATVKEFSPQCEMIPAGLLIMIINRVAYYEAWYFADV